jgi:hypothetical protein
VARLRTIADLTDTTTLHSLLIGAISAVADRRDRGYELVVRDAERPSSDVLTVYVSAVP